jgi:hypothetical protein
MRELEDWLAISGSKFFIWVGRWARSISRLQDAHDENEASPQRALRVEGCCRVIRNLM